uniref:Putative ixodes 8-cys protein n=1 Tax=Ixodes ricinus TaxID=34613 RepID=A0A0K8RAI3_IXORI
METTLLVAQALQVLRATNKKLIHLKKVTLLMEKHKHRRTRRIMKKKLGDHMPDFIGNDKDKASYLDKLLSVCQNEHSLYKVNKGTITFDNCTFICVSEGATATNKQSRIPAGLVCNSQGGKCPEEGPCPAPPLPSC